MAIELAQQIKDNQRMYLGFTLPVFALASVMAPSPQMAATSFAVQTQDPNEQSRFEPCFNQPQQSSYQKQQNHSLSVCYCCELTGYFSKDCNNPLLLPPALRNNNNQNNRIINNNVSNQRPNYSNINFFGENFLVKTTVY
ncbi:hypothetical protein G9A89_018904 [Geosiphon pyriformis]|nr:hypothetical protein G9A89_018904 [Geosiphon pyriformis]